MAKTPYDTDRDRNPASAQAQLAMRPNLKPTSAAATPCKICGGAAAVYGAVDFHKSCEEMHGFRLPPSGVQISYRRCASCGFLFTDAFDDWNKAQFCEHIYNDGYLTVDPDYRVGRPHYNADLVNRLWGQYKAKLRVLDYGGGNGVLCDTLRAAGFPVAVSYDPLVPQYARRPEGKFNLVTCFETLEHMPHPVAGIASILESVDEPGLVMLSTLVQPIEFDKLGLDWWYVGPRNGHISIFSRQALTLAWRRYGYQLVSFNDDIHFAYRVLPEFAQSIGR
jgi:2-polyprenyl-6-hydroxyphenyl methylase/3-demethylubiquinone-9 3-methyltransferase